MKVVFADRVDSHCSATLERAGIEVDDVAGQGDEALLQALAEADGLVVRSATQVDAKLMDAAPELKVVGRAGSGVDNIDVTTATARGILVMNAPGENSLAAAEHAFALILGLSRNLGPASVRMRDGEWSKEGLMGVELCDKTLGVVGMGRIGREVAARGKAFRMRVLAHDPFLPDEVAEGMGIEKVDLDLLFSESDFLTLHAPLTDKTKHLIGADSLSKCKKELRIINCARGGLVDEGALLAALEADKIAGAALDVFEEEPLPEDSPLRNNPKILLTPHLGASTSEAQEKVALRIAEQIAAYLNEGTIQNAVNLFSVDPEQAAMLDPWLKLAEGMGRMHAVLAKGSLEEVSVELSGTVLDLPGPALVSGALQGLLSGFLSREINLVNAVSAAEEHGLKLAEVRGPDPEGYLGLIKIRVSGDGGERLISGTVYAERYPKVVQVDEFFIETPLKANMLFYKNDDTPGRLAAITSSIAAHGVNIADLALGRDKDSGTAFSALHLDAPLSEDALEALRSVDGVTWAQPASFPSDT